MFLGAIVMLQLRRLRLEGRNRLQATSTKTRDLMPARSRTRKRVEMRHTIESMKLAVLMPRRRRTSIPSKSAVMLPTRRR